MVLFITLYKVVLALESVDEILKCDHSNESYREQYFPVVLLIMLYKMVLTFESVDEILKCIILLSSEHHFLWYCLLCCKTGF